MAPAVAVPPRGPELTSEAYRITLDDGRDSFHALCIEAPDTERAWLAADTVRALENMR